MERVRHTWGAVESVQYTYEEKPEALRLADELDADPMVIGYQQAAAELRRLHAVNEKLLEELEQAEQIYAHLKMWPMLDSVRAAIAAAKEQA